MSSSTVSSSRARQGGGGSGRQFPVGSARRRYVPVVDGGCGCRPRRPRLLSLPSFLKLSGRLGGGCGVKTTAMRRGTSSSSSSTSTTASFSSSSQAATHSTTGTGYSSSSAYSSSYYYSCGYEGAAATKTKQQQQPAEVLHKAAPAAGKTKKQAARQKQKKKRHESSKMSAEEEDGAMGVGVAVEKESSDPRADFRDSMVQMVVEMGLCDWDGLRCMLRRLLALNAPRHHAAILTAFAEVCAQIVAAAPVASPLHHHPSPASRSPLAYRRR